MFSPEVPIEPFDAAFLNAPPPPSDPKAGSRRDQGRSGAGSDFPARDAATVLSGGSSLRRAQGRARGPAPLPEPGERIDRSSCREHRRRRHGGGLPRPRHPARSPRRAEDPAARAGRRRRGRPAVLPGRAGRGAARPREHRPGLHDRPRRGLPLHRLRVHRGDDDPPAGRAERRPPVGEAINYTLQIAGALVHAAERGVVHRDIKPSNIIVTPRAGPSSSTWGWPAGSSAAATTG